MTYLPEKSAMLIVGVLLLLVALWMVALRPKNRLHQGLFLVIWLLGWEKVTATFATYGSVADRLMPYFAIAGAMAMLHFTIVFWYAHRPNGRDLQAWVSPTMLVATLLLVISYAAFRDWWRSPPYPTPEDYAVLARLALPGAFGLVAATTALDMAPGHHRRSLALLATGFSLEGVYRGALGLSQMSQKGILVWSDIFTWGVLAMAAIPMATAVVLGTLLHRQYLAGTIGVAGVSSVLPLVAGYFHASDMTSAAITFSLQAMWVGIGLCMIVYALLQSRMFSLDLRLKGALRHGVTYALLATAGAAVTVPLTFVAPPLVAYLLGGATIAALWRPCRRLAMHLVEGWMPDVQGTPEYHAARARRMYEAALDEALANGRLGPDGSRALLGLQRQLGVPHREAIHIERRMLDGRTISDLARAGQA